LSLRTARDRWLSYITVKRKLFPLSLLRIGYGTILFVYFIMLWPERDFFFSLRTGYYPTEYVSINSKLLEGWIQVFDSYIMLDAILLIGIVSAAFFAVGFLTKPAHLLLYASFFLLEGRNPLLFDAGDDFVQLSLLYLLFSQLNAHLSVDNWLKRGKNGAAERRPEREWAAILHNFGMIAVIIQFLLIYLISDATKVLGSKWRSGEVMYYISYAEIYNLMEPVTAMLRSYPWISVVLSYSVMLFQLLFAVLVFMKKTRPWILIVAVCFHAGIALHFGLLYFSLIMILFDVMFFSDEEWLAWRKRLRERFAALLKRKTTRVRSSAAGEN